MKDSSKEFGIKEIDWYRYLREVQKSIDFQKIQDLYVPIGIEIGHFRTAGWSPNKKPKTLRSVLDEDSRKLVLLGEPGAGKTWILRHLVLSEATDASTVPLYTELADWNISPERRAVEPSRIELFQFLWKTLRRYLKELPVYDASRSPEILEQAFSQRQFILIFDGLDEIRDLKQRRWFIYSLIDFVSRFDRRHSYLISSRKYGFFGEIADKLEIQEFEKIEMTSRPDDDLKRAILRAYLPKSVDVDRVLRKITTNYRLARLSDNVLLLNIMAENYDARAESLQTRGRLLERRVNKFITTLFKIPEDPAKDFLGQLASRMREKRERKLKEEAVVEAINIFLKKSPLDNMSSREFLDLLLSTRLIERRPGEYAEISFSLPQYEDYFLARQAREELQVGLRGNSRKKLRDVKYIKDREWHHVLILSAGLLEEKEVERLAGMLDDQRHLLLKARILGEAIAPKAETAFTEKLRNRLKGALDKALTNLSRNTIAALVLWWLGILLLAFFLNWLWPRHPWAAAGLFVTYVIGIPLGFHFLYSKLFEYEINQIIQKTLPDVLSALVSLRTGVVKIELQNFRRWLRGKIPWGAGKADEFVKFIESVTHEIDQAIELTDQDLETVLDLIERNPKLIHHWLAIHPEAFSVKEVEVLEGILYKHDPQWLQQQLQCIRKLQDVALGNASLRDQILDLLNAFVTNARAEPKLIGAAETAVEMIQQHSQKLDIAENGSTKTHAALTATWLALTAGSLLLLLVGTDKYGKGDNFWQKLDNFKWYYGGWLTLVSLGAAFALPKAIVRRFYVLKERLHKLKTPEER